MSSSSGSGVGDALPPNSQDILHAGGTPSPPADELDITQQMFGDAFPELARLFLEDSPPRLVALYGAVAARDCASLAHIVHTLCGSTSSIGATKLAALCGELETRARNNRIDEADHLAQAIKLEYARIEKKLDAML